MRSSKVAPRSSQPPVDSKPEQIVQPTAPPKMKRFCAMVVDKSLPGIRPYSGSGASTLKRLAAGRGPDLRTEKGGYEDLRRFGTALLL